MPVDQTNCIILAHREASRVRNGQIQNGAIYIWFPAGPTCDHQLCMLVPPDHRDYNPFLGELEIWGDYVDEAIRVCKDFYGTNIKTNMLHPPRDEPAPPPLPPPPQYSQTTKIDTPSESIIRVFQFVGPDKAEQLYRAMSRIMHPDVGGTDEMMKALNKAISDYKGQ